MPEHSGFKKKISIIIPTLNEEKYLERLLSQIDRKLKSRFNIELIISDGGSKDLTIEIANKIRQQRKEQRRTAAESE